MNHPGIIENVPGCCDARIIPPENLYRREQDYFHRFMPEARTVIVLGHHITSADEWIWREDEKGRYYCGADDHMNTVIADLTGQMKEDDYMIVPYPHESGLQFRYAAQAAGLGRIGRSSYLLHPEWGPWIHLRVLAMTYEADGYTGELEDEICRECEKCVEVCPAGAFDSGFDGLTCRQYRKNRGDYVPTGDRRIYKGCKLCALVCGTGKRPAGRFPRLKVNL